MVINTHNLFSEMNSKIYPVMTFIQSRMETVIFTRYNFRVSRRSSHFAEAPFLPLRACAFSCFASLSASLCSLRSPRRSAPFAPLRSIRSIRSANFAKFTINLDVILMNLDLHFTK